MSVQLKRLIVLLLMSTAIPLGSWAQPNPESGTEQTSLPDVPSNNKKLTPKLQELVKNAFKVDREEDGIVYIPIVKQSFAVKTEILFVRTRGTRVEMIASGQVATEQEMNGKKFLLIQIHRDSVVKYPVMGDLAVPMSDPMSDLDGDKKNANNFMKPEDPPEPKKKRDPGYLEFGMGYNLGLLTTSTDAPGGGNQTNDSKNPRPYKFKLLHAAYYSEFVPIGIEYNGYSGVYPTSTYYGKVVTTETSTSDINLYYRFRKFWKDRIRIMPRLSMLNDSFKTNNVDEHLISTSVSGFGLGARLSFDIVDDLWKAKKGTWQFVMLQRIYGEFGYYPFLTATDQEISRGVSDGSSGLDYKLGATVLFYFDFIPYIKRFVLEGGYSVRSYNLKFSGPTVSAKDPGNTYKVPVGSTATEKDTHYYLFFGIRIDDPIYLLMNLGGKKDEKTK